MTLKALFLTQLLGAAALAQGKPTLIDYPLDVKTALPEAQLGELQNDFRQLLARNPALMVSTRSQWKAATVALKRQDCEVRDECLQQLATTAGTLYALYASVGQNAAGTEVTATGRVVNQDRLQVRARLTFTVQRRGLFAAAARDALGQLLQALELDKLPAVLTAPVAETTTPEPVVSAPLKRQPEDLVLVVPALPPEEKPRLEAPGVGPARALAWVTGGLGVAAAAVAVGFGVSAASGRASLPADGRLLDEGQARAQAAVNRDATVTLGSGLAAGALLGTATVLFLVSAPRARTTLTLTPVPGGAHVSLTGVFGP